MADTRGHSVPVCHLRRQPGLSSRNACIPSQDPETKVLYRNTDNPRSPVTGAGLFPLPGTAEIQDPVVYHPFGDYHGEDHDSLYRHM